MSLFLGRASVPQSPAKQDFIQQALWAGDGLSLVSRLPEVSSGAGCKVTMAWSLEAAVLKVAVWEGGLVTHFSL